MLLFGFVGEAFPSFFLQAPDGLAMPNDSEARLSEISGSMTHQSNLLPCDPCWPGSRGSSGTCSQSRMPRQGIRGVQDLGSRHFASGAPCGSLASQALEPAGVDQGLAKNGDQVGSVLMHGVTDQLPSPVLCQGFDPSLFGPSTFLSLFGDA